MLSLSVRIQSDYDNDLKYTYKILVVEAERSPIFISPLLRKVLLLQIRNHYGSDIECLEIELCTYTVVLLSTESTY